MTAKPFPPVGVRGYYEQRRLVLEAIAAAGEKGLTRDELVAQLQPDVPALLPYHLLMLGDLEQIEWDGPDSDRRVRLREDGA